MTRAATLAGAASLAAAIAFASPAMAADRVLTPDSASHVFETLRNAVPGHVLVSARVEQSAVQASFCQLEDPTRCFAVDLGDPRHGCTGEIAGPWCVRFPEGRPPEQAHGSLLNVLRAQREDGLWKEVGGDGTPRAAMPSAGSSGAALAARRGVIPILGMAMALLLVPVLLGFAIGRGSRRRLEGGSRARLVAQMVSIVAPVIAMWILVPALPRIGAWDLLFSSAALSTGLILGLARMPGRALVARLTVITIAMLGALELACRILPEPAASFVPPESVLLQLDASAHASACAPLHPDLHPEVFQARTAGVRAGTPLVLHVGDSMVEGVGVTPPETFVAQLGALDRQTDHVNAGFAGASTDVELLVIRAWASRLHPSRVVLYVFGYNDLAELDRGHPCCANGPLLDTEARARCPAPGLASRRLDRLAGSPAPYPLRVSTSFSAFARRGVVAFVQLGDLVQRLSRGPGLAPEQRWDRFASLVRVLARELSESRIPLEIVYLPARASLESASPKSSGDYQLRGRVLDLGRSLGVPVLDPWDALESAVRTEGADRLFLPPPNIHFTPEGHRVLAHWLASARPGR
ncbi:MAG: SGNH/GDSL hydrolase family protein [Minicystis sp.]